MFEWLGLSDEIEPGAIPGDLGVLLTRRLSEERLWAATALVGTRAEPDDELAFDSPEERLLLEWASATLDPGAPRWFVPQAPLDTILAASGLAALGDRRVDFLVTPPWAPPFVVEVDGRQHGHAALVDAERDAALESAGYRVFRVAADEIRRAKGTALDQIEDAWGAPPDGAELIDRMLVWAPVQLHRLVLGMLEALQVGFVGGDRWVIDVRDPLGIVIDLIGPYLDLLAAVDLLWGGTIAPRDIVLGTGDRWIEYRRDGLAFAGTPLESPPGEADVRVLLESSHSSVESLPASGGVPQIVIRSAFLPVGLADPVYEGGQRVPVRTEGEEIEWAARTMLRSVFAKEDFREGQLDALFEVIEGRDCAVLLPTGAGKSLIYQLAGLILPGRTLVIDPLVALMEDQVDGLRGHGIDRVAAISSFTTRSGETKSLLQQVASGDALFVFIAPERLQTQEFRNALRQVSQTSPINLAVVDEAHCVSEWGHDFRTAYLNLGQTIRDTCSDRFATPPPILALTGTASRAVLRDVLVELGIERDSERSVVRPRSFDRDELRFTILRVDPTSADAELAGYVRSLPQRFGVPPSDFFQPRGRRTFSGIVFVPHTNGDHGVVSVREDLAPVVGRQPAFFSGGAPRGFENGWERQKRVMAGAFKSDETPLLVSTKAFGMGIDKPNIRYVVHFGMPGSIEGYYQEVGRAGRDRRRAECALVLVEYDEDRARRLLSEDVDLEDARTEHVGTSRASADDITRQLFFHFKSFRGIDTELAALRGLVTDLEVDGTRKSVRVPMGRDDEEKSARERALHRLVVLGVVRDYLVEWGPREFPVEVVALDSRDVVERLVQYVRRNQPGRVDAIRAASASAAALPISAAIGECARILIDFVYDTVERSRRRSLREMWLAARESQSDPNLLFRRRILDYLSQGAIAPALERLVDESRFQYADWIAVVSDIVDPDDAREMRGDTARLLTSYPDHPGLLFARGLSEVLHDRGDLREFVSNLEASIREARARYAAPEDEVDEFGSWLLHFSTDQRRGALAAAALVLERLGVAADAVRDLYCQSLDEGGADPELLVLALASALDETTASLTVVLKAYKGAA